MELPASEQCYPWEGGLCLRKDIHTAQACPGQCWHREALAGLGGTVSFLYTHQSGSQDAPVLTEQLLLDQKTYLGNPKTMISLSTQPGLMSKPDVEIAYAYFELVIPECALVFVFLPQEPWVVLADLICLVGFGCRNNCWQSQLAQLFVVPFTALLTLLLSVWFKAPWVVTLEHWQWDPVLPLWHWEQSTGRCLLVPGRNNSGCAWAAVDLGLQWARYADWHSNWW